MSETVIAIKNLSKCYRLGVIGGQTLREDLQRGWAKLLGKPDPLLKIDHADQGNRESKQIWALRDVSLEVKEGEILGIIGKNGAGKSTLLKILSRITAPSEGRITIKGRVGSLLEVGTGFHPELTGRENIYLNGTILGMTKAEVSLKFDEIVKFAEIEKFIDTPVKRYSSGMTVRLAFAVAAHLEPEILIIDEVLAVGDAAFQEKCLGKMKDVAGHGRTVLFVSHNMQSIREMCHEAILIERGKITKTGPTSMVVGHYLDSGRNNSATYIPVSNKDTPHLRHAELFQEGHNSGPIRMDMPISIKFILELYSKRNINIGLVIRNSMGVWIHHSEDAFAENYSGDVAKSVVATLPAYSIGVGNYSVDYFLYERNIEMFEEIPSILSFEVIFCGRNSERSSGKWQGACGPGLINWNRDIVA